MVKLNDGIFHPMYNPNGWRRPKDGTSSDKTTWRYWYNTEEKLDNSKDCFNKSKMRLDEGSEDSSGRPDGNYLVYDSGSAIEEWD